MSKNYDINIKILKGILYYDALKIKARSHIFIDQIVPSVGGIGKSGLEAMIFGVPTICDINKSKFYGYYSDCPVIHAGGKDELIKKILWLMQNQKDCNCIANKSLEWSERLKFKLTVLYLESKMEW